MSHSIAEIPNSGKHCHMTGIEWHIHTGATKKKIGKHKRYTLNEGDEHELLHMINNGVNRGTAYSIVADRHKVNRCTVGRHFANSDSAKKLLTSIQFKLLDFDYWQDQVNNGKNKEDVYKLIAEANKVSKSTARRAYGRSEGLK